MTAQVDMHVGSFPLGAMAIGAPPKLRGEQLELGKIFVGGLSRETTTNGLRVYFERFGDISDCVVMKDRSTGAPRGFGFVTYVSQGIADLVVLHRHVIDGKEVEAKRAVPRDSEVLSRSPPTSTPNGHSLPTQPHLAPVMSASVTDAGSKKIFVGGLSHETGEADFVQYFGTYGNVIDCVIMCDPHTRKPRGFGFITYETSESVDRVCANKFHDLNGKRVEVKRAIPQDRMISDDSPVCVAKGPSPPGSALSKPLSAGYNGARLGLAAWSSPLHAEAPIGVSPPLNPVLAPGVSPPTVNPADAMLAACGLRHGDPFMNFGGNFSSATNALNQGLRTTYGMGNGQAASYPTGLDNGQDASNADGPAHSTSPRVPQKMNSHAFQEKLEHLQQQQNLLQQLQQHQLHLQLAQQRHNQQQMTLQMMHQQPLHAQPGEPRPPSAAPVPPMAHAATNGHPDAHVDALGAELLSAQLARVAFNPTDAVGFGDTRAHVSNFPTAPLYH
uniref:RRM domain-containing protein n=2 Tax=Chrysotila carterae TaxID=13221 RepID=A0A7S4F3K4_CHRCT